MQEHFSISTPAYIALVIAIALAATFSALANDAEGAIIAGLLFLVVSGVYIGSPDDNIE